MSTNFASYKHWDNKISSSCLNSPNCLIFPNCLT
uniref:Uncharacterized protein n=1 Tax=Rhizophora mucronata TaxID=61149 RepID=A0A2P2R2V9_RHIMU